MTRRPDRPASDPAPDEHSIAGRSADARGASGTDSDRLPQPLGKGSPDASLGGIPKTGDSPLRPPEAPAAGREKAQVMTDGLPAKREQRDDASAAEAARERSRDVPNESPAEQIGRSSRKG